jgi:hypothetical protein
VPTYAAALTPQEHARAAVAHLSDGSVHAAYSSLLLVGALRGSAGAALIDAGRVTLGPAAAFTALHYRCATLSSVLAALVRSVRASTSATAATAGAASAFVSSSGQWLAALHSSFWSLRTELVDTYLYADEHSDVMVLREHVRQWMAQLSDAPHCGLRLYTPRTRSSSSGSSEELQEFIRSATATASRLLRLGAWLRTVALALAHDSAAVCDAVHAMVTTSDVSMTTPVTQLSTLSVTAAALLREASMHLQAVRVCQSQAVMRCVLPYFGC